MQCVSWCLRATNRVFQNRLRAWRAPDKARAGRAPDEARAGRALVVSSRKVSFGIRARALCAPGLSRAWRALIITARNPVDSYRHPWCEGIVMQCVSWCLRATNRVFQNRLRAWRGARLTRRALGARLSCHHEKSHLKSKRALCAPRLSRAWRALIITARCPVDSYRKPLMWRQWDAVCVLVPQGNLYTFSKQAARCCAPGARLTRRALGARLTRRALGARLSCHHEKSHLKSKRAPCARLGCRAPGARSS